MVAISTGGASKRHSALVGMSSCWGNHPDKTNYTTCNARTFLQPQLNKVCTATETAVLLPALELWFTCCFRQACPHPQADADGIISKCFVQTSVLCAAPHTQHSAESARQLGLLSLFLFCLFSRKFHRHRHQSHLCCVYFCLFSGKFHKNADVNLKDYVLFYANHLKASRYVTAVLVALQYRSIVCFAICFL